MIQINDTIALCPLTLEDQPELLQLMMDIYRPVYEHLWYDDGTAYVNSQFNATQLQQELEEENAVYFFVEVRRKKQGILRAVINKALDSIDHPNTTKLHRIYLSPSLHGQGIGKKVMRWLEQFASENQQQSIWLEAMDSQNNAIAFYQSLGYQVFEPFVLDSPKMRPEKRGMLRMILEL